MMDNNTNNTTETTHIETSNGPTLHRNKFINNSIFNIGMIVIFAALLIGVIVTRVNQNKVETPEPTPTPKVTQSVKKEVVATPEPTEEVKVVDEKPAAVATPKENVQVPARTPTPAPTPTPVVTPEPAPQENQSTNYSITPPQTELEMLACVIYQEAGGNACCDNCRRYVGDIVLNRVNDPRFPNTMYGVLTQSGQYGSWAWTGIVWPSRAQNYVEQDAVARAYSTASDLLAGYHSALYGAGYVWQAAFAQGTDGFWCCGHFYGK